MKGDVDRDDDYGEKDVAEDDIGDHVRCPCIIDHNCNKLPHRLLCLTPKSHTLI